MLKQMRLILLSLLPLTVLAACSLEEKFTGQSWETCQCFDETCYPNQNCIDTIWETKRGRCVSDNQICPTSKTERYTGTSHCYCKGNLKNVYMDNSQYKNYQGKLYTTGQYCDEFGFFLENEHGDFTEHEFPIVFKNKNEIRNLLTECYAYGDPSVTECKSNTWKRFAGGSSLYWNTSLVTDFSYLFMRSECGEGVEINSACSMGSYNWFNVDVSHFDTSSVTNMEGAFFQVRGFTHDISSWDFSKVTNIKWFNYESTLAFSLKVVPVQI